MVYDCATSMLKPCSSKVGQRKTAPALTGKRTVGEPRRSDMQRMRREGARNRRRYSSNEINCERRSSKTLACTCQVEPSLSRSGFAPMRHDVSAPAARLPFSVSRHLPTSINHPHPGLHLNIRIFQWYRYRYGRLKKLFATHEEPARPLAGANIKC